MRTLPLRTLIIALLPVVVTGALSQGGAHGQSGKMEVREVFEDVQMGISRGNVALFSPHFHSQVRVTLPGGQTGLYSDNQAYYLLENFLHNRAPVSFSFSTFGESDNTPYGTGSAGFTFQGIRRRAQVYVALAPERGRWVITHINIY